MSESVQGKLKLKCSEGLLRLALEAFMPQWKGHIRTASDLERMKTDAKFKQNLKDEGKLKSNKDSDTAELFNRTYQGQVIPATKGKKIMLLVPGSSNPAFAQAPGNVYNDRDGGTQAMGF